MLGGVLGNDGAVSAERISDEPASERSYIWTTAALAAERESGRREESDRAAQASLLIRVARITAGSLITLLGLALIPLPGPGIIVLAAGLSILAIDVPFAQRLLQRVRNRMPQDADGGTSRWAIIAMVGCGAIGVAASTAFFLT